MKRRALFLDRDGTVIVEKDYLKDPNGVELIPGAIEVVERARKLGYVIVMVTNQSGIERGYMTAADVEAVNQRVVDEGVRFDAMYYCPHRTATDCDCRKPKPGMVERAAREWDLDLGASIVVGDRWADVGMGRAVGARAVLVRTGYGVESEREIADPMLEVVDSIADLRL